MTQLLIIIPAEILDAVRAAATAAFGDAAKAAFVPAGSPTGDAPATHWWQSGRFTDEEVEGLMEMYAGFPSARVEPYSLMNDRARPWEVLAEMELKPLTVEWTLQ